MQQRLQGEAEGRGGAKRVTTPRGRHTMPLSFPCRRADVVGASAALRAATALLSLLRSRFALAITDARFLNRPNPRAPPLPRNFAPGGYVSLNRRFAPERECISSNTYTFPSRRFAPG